MPEREPDTEPLRIVVADDEPHARDRLRRLLSRMDGVQVVGLAETGRDAARIIEAEAPDLVMLDVQMPGLDGFGVIAAVGAERMPLTIFVTAYDEYAVRAFEQHALDYIVKPFDDDRVLDAIGRARERLHVEAMREMAERFRTLLRFDGRTGGKSAGTAAPGSAPDYLDRIAVRADGRTLLVPVSTVDWIEAAGKSVKLHVGAESHVTRAALHELEDRLDPRRFVRIHKSTIVRVDRIRELLDYLRGDYLVVLYDGTRLKMSRSRRSELEARLGQSL